jgi:hypothetical protein
MMDLGLLPHSRALNQDKLYCALYFFIVRKTTSEYEHAILTTLYLACAKTTDITLSGSSLYSYRGFWTIPYLSL